MLAWDTWFAIITHLIMYVCQHQVGSHCACFCTTLSVSICLCLLNWIELIELSIGENLTWPNCLEFTPIVICFVSWFQNGKKHQNWMKNDEVRIFFFCGANKKLNCWALITVFRDYGSKNYGTDYLFLSGSE
jgi:hypothetical protein